MVIRQLADCYNYVGLSTETTLRASLSGTFPPDSPRTGYATEGARTFYLRAAVHRHGQRPPKGLGTDKTVEAT